MRYLVRLAFLACPFLAAPLLVLFGLFGFPTLTRTLLLLFLAPFFAGFLFRLVHRHPAVFAKCFSFCAFCGLFFHFLRSGGLPQAMLCFLLVFLLSRSLLRSLTGPRGRASSKPSTPRPRFSRHPGAQPIRALICWTSGGERLQVVHADWQLDRQHSLDELRQQEDFSISFSSDGSVETRSTAVSVVDITQDSTTAQRLEKGTSP